MTTTIDNIVTNGHNGTGNILGVSEDPLAFFRKIAGSLGISIKGDNFLSYRNRIGETDPLMGTSLFTRNIPPSMELMIALAYSSNGTYHTNGLNAIDYLNSNPNSPYPSNGTSRPLPEHFQEAFYSNGGYSDRFRVLTDNLQFFKQYSKNMLVRFSLLYNRTERSNKLNMEIKIHQPESGVFSMESYELGPDTLPSHLHDITRMNGFHGDYRPFLHRMLEMFANVQKNKWHNPAMYTGTPLIDEALPQYFTPQEVASIKEHERAFFQSRRDFASVPRLNLGPIVLPTPGADIATQLYDRGQFVVEYLSQIGYMSRQEATALIAQRVINHLMQDFQRSPEAARTILGKL